MAWSKSILKENRFPKTLQKLPVSICQHLNITNLLCHGERSGPVTKHWGTSQSVTDGRPASVLTSHKTCQSWPVIRLVMRRFTCWQLTALKNFLSGQECNRSHCFSAAISLNVSLSAQVTAFRKWLVTKSNPLYFRGQRRGGQYWPPRLWPLKYKGFDLVTSHLRNAVTWAERETFKEIAAEKQWLRLHSWPDKKFLRAVSCQQVNRRMTSLMTGQDWQVLWLVKTLAGRPSVTDCDVPQCFVTGPLRSPWHNRFVMFKCWQMLTGNFWSVLGNLFSFKILFDQAIVVPAWCTSIRSQPMSI